MLDIAVPPHGLQVPLFGLSVIRRLRASGGGRPGLALVEVSVVEQRYRAVLEVRAGVPVTAVAARAGVSRQRVHAWVRRYEQGGLGALADRPKRPDTCPHQTSAQVEAAVCEMRREHPKWGPLRLARAGQGRGEPGAIADERLPGPGPARAGRARAAEAAEVQLPAVGTR